MTAAVLDRGRPAAPWRATLRGPVPATLLNLVAVAVLATGVLPVVRTGAVLAGLAAAALAVGTDWLSRATSSTVRTVARTSSRAVRSSSGGRTSPAWAGTSSRATAVPASGPSWPQPVMRP